ncbi:phosphoribosylformylglycinamidine synthase [Candidatus Magnetaquicoccus inordinatus]|uniref:phosphoribosylformylglycinamidine synthase n=1 Tax=Candidatus Magnetaquicoccus inordinatus TaxID=2496818 RepID=UPI00102AA687|nr:phosphoribosylformylglycinamidine synthase [Candidatus Magnetaquicoccus inordinatus]
MPELIQLAPEGEHTGYYLVLPGADGPSPFYQEQLRAAGMPLREVRYRYLLSLRQPLPESQLQRLLALLHVPGADSSPTAPANCLVIPRIGSLSPWSSKASEIAWRCGLQEVERLERALLFSFDRPLSSSEWSALLPQLHDRMTQQVVENDLQARALFCRTTARPVRRIPLQQQGRSALQEANKQWGLALSEPELDYLLAHFQQLARDPTDVELMMFAQANSEHCRHKIFNTRWQIDGAEQEHSLFAMIRNSERCAPQGTILAYRDNAAIMEGASGLSFAPDPETAVYGYQELLTHLLMKVETHNHPTAISPFPGAATGSGGEIRDEGATGQGSQPKAGLCGFSVSNLHLPGALQPWEQFYGKPEHIVSPLQIMIEGPLGAAAFNNEFGRPNLCGYFRTFEMPVQGVVRGYHKPIMIAGGIGMIDARHVAKQPLQAGMLIVQLGGPAMLIGLGGGAASSQSSGTSKAELDFASVQRDNAEMQRRCQEVINRCCRLGTSNPIRSLHDVGAGGLSNAVPELLHGGGVGGQLCLEAIPNADPGMSPMEIWCNEAQERYVLAIDAQDEPLFAQICARELAPWAVLGLCSAENRLLLTKEGLAEPLIDLSLELLLGKPPLLSRMVERKLPKGVPLSWQMPSLLEAVERVLHLPTVADKGFLITIGDRSVTGLVSRDQMVGPWQVAVADVAVTCRGYHGYVGEAMAMGERTPVALLNGPSSARLAIAEALTNLAAADVRRLDQVKLSANWMAAAGFPGEDAALYETVHAVGMEICPQLGIGIPVGKDSLSMKTVWQEDGQQRQVVAPLSLIISAFAPVADVRRTLTPQLRWLNEETVLVVVDLGNRRNRLGGSALAQVYGQLGEEAADLDQPQQLRAFFAAIQELRRQELLLAYHDRSDGGLLVTLSEMAFAGHLGWQVALDGLGEDPLAILFSEEPGAVLQVRQRDLTVVLQQLQGVGHCQMLGPVTQSQQLQVSWRGEPLVQGRRVEWQRWWSESSWRLRSLRDDPECAAEEYATLLDEADPGLQISLPSAFSAPAIIGKHAPQVAILREQGTNGQVEMAAAFQRAGFMAVDLPMSDLLSGRVRLQRFHGLAVCGGFSYGDVLGAGSGWARSILYHEGLRQQFSQFFQRSDTFSLGVCNGCQMLSQLQELIPGTEGWPRFVANRSGRFEARFSLVQIPENRSLLLGPLAGGLLPVPCSHGEGRALFAEPEQIDLLRARGQIALQFVDHYGEVTESYPANPNGSPLGITGLTSLDGRATILMPHPERVFRTCLNSWHPEGWGEEGPWQQLFHNARRWLARGE